MQPPPFERARFLKSVAWLLLASALLVGCGEATSMGGPSPLAPETRPAAGDENEREAAIERLRQMQRTAFDTAFTELGRYAFTRSVRTEKRASDETVAAFRQRTLQYRPQQPRPASVPGTPTFDITPVDADSSGAFDASVLGQFAPAAEPGMLPVNLGAQAFPDDPPYLTSRKQEAFQFTLCDDTFENAPVQVVTVQARTTPLGQDQTARYAELVIHRDTNELLAARAVYAVRTLVYAQDTRFEMTLTRGPDDTWIPASTSFRAILDMLFRDPIDLSTTASYTDVRRP